MTAVAVAVDLFSSDQVGLIDIGNCTMMKLTGVRRDAKEGVDSGDFNADRTHFPNGRVPERGLTGRRHALRHAYWCRALRRREGGVAERSKRRLRTTRD